MEPGKKLSLSRRTWEWLQVESGRWEAAGLITAAQKESILGFYRAPAGRRGSVIAVLTVLGALLLGLGVILFIAHNWRAIPGGVKLTGIIILVAAAHIGGYYLWHVRGSYPRLGHSLILLGCLLFGAGIWLVAQIFHLQAHWPNGVLAWALGSWPVAFGLRSRPILALSAALLGLWFIFDQAVAQQVNWFYPFIAAFLAAAVAHRFRAPETLWLSFLGLAVWVVLVPLLSGHPTLMASFSPVLLGLLGASLAAAGLWHQQRFPDAVLAGPYQHAGALIFLTGAILANAELFRWAYPASTTAWLNWGLAGLLTTPVLIFTAMLLKGKPDRLDGIAVPWLGIPVAAAGLLLYTFLIPRSTGAQFLYQIWGNAVILAASLGVVVWGFRKQATFLINLGLLAFGLQILLIYFRVFFNMLQGSLFFMVGGLVLLSLGFFLERWRRRLLKGGRPA